MVSDFIDGHFYRCQFLHGFLDVELRDFSHRAFTELQHIVARNLFAEHWAVGVEGSFYLRDLVFPTLGTVVLQHLIDSLLEENLLQTHPVPSIL